MGSYRSSVGTVGTDHTDHTDHLSDACIVCISYRLLRYLLSTYSAIPTSPILRSIWYQGYDIPRDQSIRKVDTINDAGGGTIIRLWLSFDAIAV